MSRFNMSGNLNVMSDADLDLLAQTLNAWCKEKNIRRDEADCEAKVLIDTFASGRRTQKELLSALSKFQAVIH